MHSKRALKLILSYTHTLSFSCRLMATRIRHFFSTACRRVGPSVAATPRCVRGRRRTRTLEAYHNSGIHTYVQLVCARLVFVALTGAHATHSHSDAWVHILLQWYQRILIVCTQFLKQYTLMLLALAKHLTTVDYRANIIGLRMSPDAAGTQRCTYLTSY